MEFGLLADDVLSVRHLPVKELQPSLPTLTGVRAEFLKGVSAESLVVLDGAKLSQIQAWLSAKSQRRRDLPRCAAHSGRGNPGLEFLRFQVVSMRLIAAR